MYIYVELIHTIGREEMSACGKYEKYTITSLYLSISISLYIYTYIHTYICVCVYIYIHTYIPEGDLPARLAPGWSRRCGTGGATCAGDG